MIVKYCGNPKFDQDDELRENCFQAFEVLAMRCTKEMTPHIDSVMSLALKFIKYDPNYAADDDENEEMDVDEAAEDEEEEEAGDYSDDDDMSWKVRRSSTKCLCAIITTRIDLLHTLYQKVGPVLISRFREREENVKVDVFRAFTDLLRQTAISNKRSSSNFVNTTNELLGALIPKAVARITAQLREKSAKTRLAAFAVLKELVAVAPGCMSARVSDLVPGLVFSLREKAANSSLRVEALAFLRLLLASHPPEVFFPHVATLAPHVLKAMGDPYYRIAAEGLRAGAQLALTIRPAAPFTPSFEFRPHVPGLYNAALGQLRAQDIDQEVKECALYCVGTIIAVLGDELRADLPACLALLLDRLRNEITRLTAVKVLATIAASELKVDLSPILPDAFAELASFLRKSNRQLRQSSLLTLGTLVEQYGAPSTLSVQVLPELSALVSDADLFLSHLALLLCVQVMRSAGAAATPAVQERIVPQAFELVKSPLLQGVALTTLLLFFSELVSLNPKVITFEFLIDNLLSMTKQKDALNKQAYTSVAQGVAAVCTSAKPSQRDTVVSKFIKEFPKAKDDGKLLSLLAIGEIGRRADLSHHETLHALLMLALEQPSEEVKHAASFALGNVTVGSMEKYLPMVLQEITAHAQRQYLLLHSLREIIIRQSSVEGQRLLQPYLPSILTLLFTHCESTEEGTRNVVAECLGKMSLLAPQDVLPILDEKFAGSTFARATAVTAVKYAVSESPTPAASDTQLQPHMPRVLRLLQDPEPLVRRSVLLTLNYTAHHKPDLIRDILPEFLPSLYAETKVRPELIKEMDLGPFKHKDDQGLDIRKNAYECMYTFLDTAIDRIDIQTFVQHIAQGMSDHYDIKMLTHLMLIRLANTAGAALLEGVDRLVEPLRETITSKVNDTDVKQEADRHEELVRSALRAVAAIARIPSAECVPSFRDFVRNVVLGTPAFAERYREVSREELAAGAAAPAAELAAPGTPTPPY
eukprot:TRINITY_DN3125_c0_g1_i5.p1 TRINITY_DN3125_c0_g1~~TRINITY_DN3125_c0_g1_i5.p1  ORF type:complete len:986 (-),score=291.67 TRINITY_DN3125_c0_g1_i5:67-3024(-)